jgi:hypothetical protein
MSFFDRVEKPTPKSDEDLFELMASEAVVGHKAGLQVKNIDSNRGVRFMGFPDPLLELDVELAASAWRYICVEDKHPGCRHVLKLMTYHVATARLLESLGRGNEGTGELVEDRFDHCREILESPQGRAAVKALAKAIDDRLVIPGSEAADIIELALAKSKA